MIIKIKNFGPIKEFEIDLSKDFSIIYGKNNIGKSYAVSVVYLILKKIISYNIHNKMMIPFNPTIIKEILKKVANIVAEKSIVSSSIHTPEPDIHELFQSKIKKEQIESIKRELFQKGFVGELQRSLVTTFGDNISNKFFNEKPEIHINAHKVKIVLSKTNDDFIISQYKANRILDSKIDNIYYFPASRIGIYQGLSSFSSIFAELSKSRGSIKKSFEIPSFPEPVSDYFLALSSIKKGVTDPNNPIVLLAQEIEQTVLGGEVIFDDDTKKMIYKPYHTDLYLDMFQVSSMAAEISPLVLFLKYIIAPSHNKKGSKSLLFIEEPEAHLHPEIQVKLMEIFAKLVKHNIKIIITSHSDFMFNKMNNLILEKKLDISKSCAIILEASEQGSISKVLPTDDLGVEDENFIGTTEHLLNERTELIDKLNKDS
jgi:predicted ATPase